MFGGFAGMGQMILRNADPADMEAILAIERDSYRDPWGEESFNFLLRHGGIGVVAAYRFPIGYAFGRVTVDEAELLNLAVSRVYRKKNIGRAILNEFLQACWRKGAQKVFLEVRVGNASAVHLYRSTGFDIISRRKQYYQDGEDAFIMQLNRTA